MRGKNSKKEHKVRSPQNPLPSPLTPGLWTILYEPAAQNAAAKKVSLQATHRLEQRIALGVGWTSSMSGSAKGQKDFIHEGGGRGRPYEERNGFRGDGMRRSGFS